MTLTNRAFVVAAAGLLASVLGACHAPEAKEDRRSGEEAAEKADELPLREVAPRATTSIHQVLASAAAARPGTALEAGLEGERAAGGADVFFEVMVLDGAGGVWELKVDPATGAVTSNKSESDAEEIGEMKTLAAQLGSGHLSLGELAAHAESTVPGAKALAAAFKVHDGRPVARVKLAKDGVVSVVAVDARSGKPVAAKKSGEEDEDDEGDEEGGSRR